MKHKKTKNAGFSLIEVLFAMLFMTVIVFGVLRLQTSNLVLSNTEKNELKAHFYANQALEIAQAIGPSAFKPCDPSCHLVKNGDSYGLQMNGAEALDEGLFQRSFDTTADSLKNAVLVTSKVIWTDSSGEHQVTAKRVVFETAI